MELEMEVVVERVLGWMSDRFGQMATRPVSYLVPPTVEATPSTILHAAMVCVTIAPAALPYVGGVKGFFALESRQAAMARVAIAPAASPRVGDVKGFFALVEIGCVHRQGMLTAIAFLMHQWANHSLYMGWLLPQLCLRRSVIDAILSSALLCMRTVWWMAKLRACRLVSSRGRASRG
jgi:hypothetical protein